MGIRSQGSAGAGDASVASAAMGRWHPVGLSFPLSLTHSYTQSLSSPIFLLILTHSLSYTHTISLTPPPQNFLTHIPQKNKTKTTKDTHTHNKKHPKNNNNNNSVFLFLSDSLSYFAYISHTHLSISHTHYCCFYSLSQQGRWSSTRSLIQWI